jgi:hypothetical protein
MSEKRKTRGAYFITRDHVPILIILKRGDSFGDDLRERAYIGLGRHENQDADEFWVETLGAPFPVKIAKEIIKIAELSAKKKK